MCNDLFRQKRNHERLFIMVSVTIFLLLVMSTLMPPTVSDAASLYQPASPTPPPPVNSHPGQAIFNPIGIGLALSFIILMLNLFRWMFRVPPQMPYTVAKARQSIAAIRKILVPTREEVASERAVELACRLGEAQQAEIILTYVIEVPYTLSMDTPLPSAEAKAQEAIRTARFIVEQHGLQVKPKLIHHRTVWGGILAVAREELVDAIVMSVHSGFMEGVSGTANEVVKRAECEVILDRVPPRTAPLRSNHQVAELVKVEREISI